MPEPKEIPNEIKAIAQNVHMHPIAWTIHPDFIVIVFEEGAKMIFEREKVSPMIEKINPIKSAPSAAPSTEPPLISAPPIQSSRKKGKTKS